MMHYTLLFYTIEPQGGPCGGHMRDTDGTPCKENKIMQNPETPFLTGALQRDTACPSIKTAKCQQI